MARHPLVLRDPAQQGPGATGKNLPLLPKLPQRSSNQPCSTPSASRTCLFPAHVNEATAAIRRCQRCPGRDPTRRRSRTSPRPLPFRWRIASKLTFSRPSPPRCSGVGAPVGRSEEEDESMMKQHARESCEDESMMKQHVIQVKSFQDNSMHEGAVLAKCWPVAAGAWRAHVDRGPSRMRFDTRGDARAIFVVRICVGAAYPSPSPLCERLRFQ